MTLFDLDERAAPTGPLVRVRLTVAYHGAAFHGFAENVGVTTVAGVLREAIERVLRHPVELVCAGRTDRGVHGNGQVVSFDAAAERLDLGRLTKAVNKLCGPNVAVRDGAVVGDDFDARHSARWRHYRYLILQAPTPDPFLHDRVWRVDTPLDLRAMRLGADVFLGEHDFSAFCRRPKGRPEASLVRLIHWTGWSRPASDQLCFEIVGSSFCHQMVRSVVGTLVEVGRGSKRAGDLRAILASGDRSAAGQLAPPQGLCLWQVGYEPWRSEATGDNPGLGLGRSGTDRVSPPDPSHTR